MTLKLPLLLFAFVILVVFTAAVAVVTAQNEDDNDDSRSNSIDIDDTPILPGEQAYTERKEFSNILVKHPDHDEEPASEDADSELSPHEAMRCHVCRHAVKPALINAIQERAGIIDSKELVDGVLRELAHKHIYDLESKSIIMREVPEEKKFTDLERDENIHHFIEHLLWDEHLACQLYGLADVYVQQPRRRHWFSRLVDHAICPCHNGKELLRLDHGIDKYLMNHIAATTEAMKRYKMGHEIFDDVNNEDVSSNRVEMQDMSEIDKSRDKMSSSIGTIWVDRDGHLDEKVQHEHEMQPTLSQAGAHDDEGAGAWGM